MYLFSSIIQFFSRTPGWESLNYVITAHFRCLLRQSYSVTCPEVTEGRRKRYGLYHGVRKEWVVNTTPRPLYPPGQTPGTLCTNGWVGLGACLNGVRKMSSDRDSNPEASRSLRVTMPTTLVRPLAAIINRV